MRYRAFHSWEYTPVPRVRHKPHNCPAVSSSRVAISIPTFRCVDAADTPAASRAESAAEVAQSI